jgi:hypothetical protein
LSRKNGQLGFIGIYGIYWDLLGYIGIYWDLLGFIGIAGSYTISVFGPYIISVQSPVVWYIYGIKPQIRDLTH